MSHEQALIKSPNHSLGEAFEKIVVKNDLTDLTPAERMQYYNKLCQSLGLNPLTKPFEYLTLNSKLSLYARKDATDQLRKNYSISIELSKVEILGKNLYVWAKAILPNGRHDVDVGCVPNSGHSNDIMKCLTKAKRRVTLSICGLGILDESEMAGVPNAKKIIMFKYCPLCKLKTYNIDLERCEKCGKSLQEIQHQMKEK